MTEPLTIGAVEHPSAIITFTKTISHAEAEKFRAAIEIGLAWQAAEAALPEDLDYLSVALYPDGCLAKAGRYAGREDRDFTEEGATPAVALRALTERLADQ